MDPNSDKNSLNDSSGLWPNGCTMTTSMTSHVRSTSQMTLSGGNVLWNGTDSQMQQQNTNVSPETVQPNAGYTSPCDVTGQYQQMHCAAVMEEFLGPGTSYVTSPVRDVPPPTFNQPVQRSSPQGGSTSYPGAHHSGFATSAPPTSYPGYQGYAQHSNQPSSPGNYVGNNVNNYNNGYQMNGSGRSRDVDAINHGNILENVNHEDLTEVLNTNVDPDLESLLQMPNEGLVQATQNGIDEIQFTGGMGNPSNMGNGSSMQRTVNDTAGVMPSSCVPGNPGVARGQFTQGHPGRILPAVTQTYAGQRSTHAYSTSRMSNYPVQNATARPSIVKRLMTDGDSDHSTSGSPVRGHGTAVSGGPISENPILYHRLLSGHAQSRGQMMPNVTSPPNQCRPVASGQTGFHPIQSGASSYLQRRHHPVRLPMPATRAAVLNNQRQPHSGPDSGYHSMYPPVSQDSPGNMYPPVTSQNTSPHVQDVADSWDSSSFLGMLDMPGPGDSSSAQQNSSNDTRTTTHSSQWRPPAVHANTNSTMNGEQLQQTGIAARGQLMLGSQGSTQPQQQRQRQMQVNQNQRSGSSVNYAVRSPQLSPSISLFGYPPLVPTSARSAQAQARPGSHFSGSNSPGSHNPGSHSSGSNNSGSPNSGPLNSEPGSHSQGAHDTGSSGSSGSHSAASHRPLSVKARMRDCRRLLRHHLGRDAPDYSPVVKLQKMDARALCVKLALQFAGARPESGTNPKPPASEFHCLKCEKRYGYFVSLRQHYRKVHGEEIGVLANNQEMRTSSDQGKFTCHLCHNPFTYYSSLAVHLQTKHGVKTTGSAAHRLLSALTPSGPSDHQPTVVNANFNVTTTTSATEGYPAHNGIDDRASPSPSQHVVPKKKCGWPKGKPRGRKNADKTGQITMGATIQGTIQKKKTTDGVRGGHPGVFQCPHCPKIVKYKRMLILHLKSRHPRSQTIISAETKPKAFICKLCSQSFQFFIALKKHMKYSHKKQTVSTSDYVTGEARASGKDVTNGEEESGDCECGVCGKKFAQPQRLSQHMKLKHQARDDSRFDCSQCNEKFYTRIDLFRHRKRHHGGGQGNVAATSNQPDVSGDVATNSINDVISANSDVTREEGAGVDSEPPDPRVRPAQKSSDAMNKLTMLKTRIRYKCTVCGTGVLSGKDFKRHWQTDHSGAFDIKHLQKVAPICPVCHKAVTNLQRHIVHQHPSGPSRIRYNCRKCSQSFTYTDSLRTHYKKVHKLSASVSEMPELRGQNPASTSVTRYNATHTAPATPDNAIDKPHKRRFRKRRNGRSRIPPPRSETLVTMVTNTRQEDKETESATVTDAAGVKDPLPIGQGIGTLNDAVNHVTNEAPPSQVASIEEPSSTEEPPPQLTSEEEHPAASPCDSRAEILSYDGESILPSRDLRQRTSLSRSVDARDDETYSLDQDSSDPVAFDPVTPPASVPAELPDADVDDDIDGGGGEEEDDGGKDGSDDEEFVPGKQKKKTNHQCDKCERSYSRRRDLRLHQLYRHASSKQTTFKCGFCPRSYPLPTSLRAHCLSKHNVRLSVTTHTNIRDDLSDQKIPPRSNGRLVGKREPGFSCRKCKCTYHSGDGLRRHYKRVHGVIASTKLFPELQAANRNPVQQRVRKRARAVKAVPSAHRVMKARRSNAVQPSAIVDSGEMVNAPPSDTRTVNHVAESAEKPRKPREVSSPSTTTPIGSSVSSDGTVKFNCPDCEQTFAYPTSLKMHYRFKHGGDIDISDLTGASPDKNRQPPKPVLEKVVSQPNMMPAVVRPVLEKVASPPNIITPKARALLEKVVSQPAMALKVTSSPKKPDVLVVQEGAIDTAGVSGNVCDVIHDVPHVTDVSKGDIDDGELQHEDGNVTNNEKNSAISTTSPVITKMVAVTLVPLKMPTNCQTVNLAREVNCQSLETMITSDDSDDVLSHVDDATYVPDDDDEQESDFEDVLERTFPFINGGRQTDESLNIYKCDDCEFSCKQLQTLELHNRFQHVHKAADTDVQSAHEPSVHQNTSDMGRHARGKRNVPARNVRRASKTYTCRKCDRVYKNETAYKIHSLQKHDARMTSTRGRKRRGNVTVAMAANGVVRHGKTSHVTGKHFKCPVCGCSYRHQRSLVTHYKRKHGEDSADLFNSSDENFNAGVVCSEKYAKQGSVQKNNISDQLSGKVNSADIGTNERNISCDLMVSDESSLPGDFRLELEVTDDVSKNGDADEIPDTSQSLESGQMHFPPIQRKPSHRFVCQVCAEEFTDRELFASHVETHDEDKLFTCPTCNQWFENEGAMTRHCLREHGGGATSRSPSYYSDAEEESDVISTTHVCDVCEAGFPSHVHLKHHERVHTARRRKAFRCNFCLKRFRLHADLVRHRVLEHYSVGAFRCRHCARTFARHRSLIIHEITHVGSKDLSCSTCGRRCYSSISLQRHTETHVQQEVTARGALYKCSVCEVGFEELKELEKHVNSAHMYTSVPVPGHRKAHKIVLAPVDRRTDHAAPAPVEDVTLPISNNTDILSGIMRESGKSNQTTAHTLDARPAAGEAVQRIPIQSGEDEKIANAKDKSTVCSVCGKEQETQMLLKLHELGHKLKKNNGSPPKSPTPPIEGSDTPAKTLSSPVAIASSAEEYSDNPVFSALKGILASKLNCKPPAPQPRDKPEVCPTETAAFNYRVDANLDSNLSFSSSVTSEDASTTDAVIGGSISLSSSMSSGVSEPGRKETVGFALVCEVCNKVFRERSAYEKHRLTHAPTHVSTHVPTHAPSHAKTMPFQCLDCGAEFREQDGLVRHVSNVHSDSVPCKFCGVKFEPGEALTQHMISHRTASIKRKRSEMTTQSPSANGMISVEQTPEKMPRTDESLAEESSIEEPVACDFCLNLFPSRKTLYRHKLTHLSVRLPRCDNNKIIPVHSGVRDAHVTAHVTEAMTPMQTPCPRLTPELSEWSTCGACGLRFRGDDHLSKHKCRGASGRRKPRPLSKQLADDFGGGIANLHHVGLNRVNMTAQTDTWLGGTYSLSITPASHSTLVNTRTEFDMGLSDLSCDKTPVYINGDKCDVNKTTEDVTTKEALLEYLDDLGNSSPNFDQDMTSSCSDSNDDTIQATANLYKCSRCTKSYKDVRSLQHHVLIHSGVKPHVCQICGARFHCSQFLKRHVTSRHSSERFTCDVCGRTYNREGSLAQHRRLHTKVGLFECGVCQKKLISRTRLNNHMLCHTEQHPTGGKEKKTRG